jgi:hypothetical protein
MSVLNVPNSLEVAIIPSIALNVKQEDGTTQSYKLVYNYNAIARAEQTIGRDLKRIESWQGLTSAQVASIVWCGLATHHPDVKLEQVYDMLNPAAHEALFELLIEQFFPGIVERIKEAAKKDKAGTDPNVPAADKASA